MFAWSPNTNIKDRIILISQLVGAMVVTLFSRQHSADGNEHLQFPLINSN